MNQPIICGVDDSPVAGDAVSVAGALSRALGIDLVLLHVVTPPIGLAVPLMGVSPSSDLEDRLSRSRGMRLLEQRAREIAPQQPELAVAAGAAPDVILDAAARVSARLIVVGHRGLGALASAVLGSTSSELITRARCPVVIVPAEATLRPGAVLCAVDETPSAPYVLAAARGLATRLDARLVLVHAVTHKLVPALSVAPAAQYAAMPADRAHGQTFLDELAYREGLGADVEREVRVAETAEADAIAEVAEEQRASMIVIGSRQHGVIRSALSGSVCMELPLVAKRPIVAVP